MEDWLDRVADALGEPRLAPKELGALLKLTRDVAHGVERKFAPVSAYLVGVAVGQRTAAAPRPATIPASGPAPGTASATCGAPSAPRRRPSPEATSTSPHASPSTRSTRIPRGSPSQSSIALSLPILVLPPPASRSPVM